MWEAMWRRGIAPGQAFDASRTEPALTRLLKEGNLKGRRALVPGCGRGYSLVSLSKHYDNVVGLEISETAAEVARGHVAAEGADGVEVEVGDFFALDMSASSSEGKDGGDDGLLFDLIYDCTFLCAIPPTRREDWAAVMYKNLAVGGQLVTLIFPVVDSKDNETDDPGLAEGAMSDGSGPPFRMTVPLVRNLCEKVGLVLVGDVEKVPDDSRARKFAGEYIARWTKVEAAEHDEGGTREEEEEVEAKE